MESNPNRPRKVRFPPKPRTLRPEQPVPQLKREVADNDFADDDELNEALSRQVNARVTRSHTQAEKKSSVHVALAHGIDSSSSLRSFGKRTRGKKDNVGPDDLGLDPTHLDLSSVVISDDIVESSENPSIITSPKKTKKKEYKEPWDYERSNYPITLPLRKPYSGDPEILDEEEFGAKATSSEYVEDDKDSAFKLGLLMEKESDDKRMIFFQLPSKMPLLKHPRQTPTPPADGVAASNHSIRPNVSGGTSKSSSFKPAGNNTEQWPAGHMGKMLVYKSGAVKLKIGDILYDVSPGINFSFAQDVVAINKGEKQCSELGKIENIGAIVTPDIDYLLGHEN